ncbi:MAG: HD-GYP domain-containing protein [Bacillota bacterium]
MRRSTTLWSTEWTGLPTALQQTLCSIVQALEDKDASGPGHSARVAAFGARLAQSTGLSPADIQVFMFASFLHDIGKIAVSDVILQKRGPLSAAEYLAVQVHPLAGAHLLRPLLHDAEPRILDVVLYHHERFDGKGYPHGVAGTSIPLWARICSIADAWDVMTTVRPYRPRLSLEEALDELHRCSGTQFDPELVTLFVDTVVPDITATVNNQLGLALAEVAGEPPNPGDRENPAGGGVAARGGGGIAARGE